LGPRIRMPFLALERTQRFWMQPRTERVPKKDSGPFAAHLRCMEKTCVEATTKLAYDLWLGRGCPDGSPDDDWYEAERILNANNAKGASTEASITLKASVAPRSKKSKKPKARANGR
jgi:DUF2934 family protein